MTDNEFLGDNDNIDSEKKNDDSDDGENVNGGECNTSSGNWMTDDDVPLLYWGNYTDNKTYHICHLCGNHGKLTCKECLRNIWNYKVVFY